MNIIACTIRKKTINTIKHEKIDIASKVSCTIENLQKLYILNNLEFSICKIV